MSSSESFGAKLKKAFTTELTQKEGKKKTKLDKKTKLKIFGVIVAMILVFPIPLGYPDGGTTLNLNGDYLDYPIIKDDRVGGSKEYRAILYRVRSVHDFTFSKEKNVYGYYNGTIIKILGLEVYNSVEFVPE